MGDKCINVKPNRTDYKRVAQAFPAEVILFVIILLNTAGTAYGGCRIYVSGAILNTGLNGYYNEQGICNDRLSYLEDSYIRTFFVSYRTSGVSSSWVIRLTGCNDGYVYARNPNSEGIDRPVGLPGYWEEYNGTEYTQNRHLTVECVDDGDHQLNSWQIFGIVMGCICGALFILFIIAAICKISKQKKQQQQRAAAQPNSYPQTAPVAVYNTGGGELTVTTVSGTKPVPAYNPYFPPAPPYSNVGPYPGPPPVYATVYNNPGVDNQEYK